MKLFNFKPRNDLSKLLKQSAQDFQFDHQKVKQRLLYSLRDAPIKQPQITFMPIRILKYSSIIAAMLIFLSATFAFASNAKPGDKRFALSKLGESSIRSL